METIICRDIDGNLNEVPVDKMVFQPSVYGVLANGGRVLLSKQWDGYDWPGGRMNMNESIEECLKREFREETGLKIKLGELLYAQDDFFLRPYTKEPHHTILLYYACEHAGGELSITNIDENEKKYIGMPEWVDREEASKVKFYNPIDNGKLLNILKKKLNFE